MNIQGSAVAAEDLEQGQYIQYDNGGVKICPAGERPDGVTTDSAKQGQRASFAVLGNVRVKAGVALSEGARVEVGVGSRAIVLDQGEVAGFVRVFGLAPDAGQFATAEIIFSAV